MTYIHIPIASDIENIVNQVDQLLQSFESFTHNASGFQKLEDVKEDKAGVTKFFDTLGHLFTNGTIGHFEDEVCFCRKSDAFRCERDF